MLAELYNDITTKLDDGDFELRELRMYNNGLVRVEALTWPCSDAIACVSFDAVRGYIDDDGEFTPEDVNPMLHHFGLVTAPAVIIFDNGGGITLQLHGWAHTFDDATEAAEAFCVFADNWSAEGFDGHDDMASDIHPSTAELDNGCYEVVELDPYTPTSTLDAVWGELAESSSSNMVEFGRYMKVGK